MKFLYYDLVQGIKSDNVNLLFPDFHPSEESITIISPHDDDALLGAGYLIQAVRALGVEVQILIVCDGRAGYSRPEDKPGIVERRKREARSAYQLLELPESRLYWLGIPDFSAIHYLGWTLPGAGSGLFAKVVPLLRRLATTRLVIPNGHREHIDHTASHLAGLFFGPQAGDAVLADWGRPTAVKTTLVYSVWADFPPAADRSLRANRALVAPAAAEDRVMNSLAKFESQAGVIAGLVEARKQRRRDGRALELYLALDPRPALSYQPYWEEIASCD